MTITLGKPWAVNEKGGRQNNEDSIYPLSELATSDNRLFLVCDGVGGNEKGEVASALACESLQSYFNTFLTGDPSETFVRNAIQYTETRFDDYIQSHPEAKGMATTLTLVYIGASGVTFAHIGDSRIYLLRDGKIHYVTEDHSLVNSLLKMGKITSGELASHPRKNVITQAIQGTDNPTHADVLQFHDLHAGDYLFMCTDGVLENISNQDLSVIFGENSSDECKKNKILDICEQNSRDNYSFYLIPVAEVNESGRFKQILASILYSFI